MYCVIQLVEHGWQLGWLGCVLHYGSSNTAVVMCTVAVVSVLTLLHRSQIKHIFVLSVLLVLLALLKYNENKMIVFSDQNTTIHEA